MKQPSKESAEKADVITGEIIRRRRRELGMTMLDLSQSAGVAYQQIQKYETGTNRISVSKLIKLAKGLGCTASDIVREAEERLASEKAG